MEHKKMPPPGFIQGRSVHITFDNSHGKQHTLTWSQTTHHTTGTIFQAVDVWWAFFYNPWGFDNWNSKQPKSESQRWPNARWIQYQLADNRYIHQDESHNGKAQSYTEENIRYPDLFNSQRD